MARTSCDADGSALVLLLRICAKKKDLYGGLRVHVDILRGGLLEKRAYVANSLVSMYAKCGALSKAQQVLEELPSRDVVSWSALIAGYAQLGHGKEAMNCFELMQREGFLPDAVTFICILKACGNIGALDKGEFIHNEIERMGLLGKDVVIGNALVDMYVKCGALSKAERVLMELPSRDVISWSALISGYAQQGQGHNALSCFDQMQHEGLSPNIVTFICLLKACGSLGATDKGEQIQDEIVRKGLLETHILLGTALADMYAKCGALAKAKQVLYELGRL